VSENTRTALRAAVAAALAIVISPLVTAERPYWTILIAVVVINDTLGSSLRKTWHRVGMTGAGCVAGWALHFISEGRSAVERALLLLAIFWAAYFRKSSYPWMTFFVTVYVAFLFTVLGQWSASLMLVRLEDTVLGGLIAVAASLIVPAPRVARQLEEDLASFWQDCREQVERGFTVLAYPDREDDEWLRSRGELLRRAEKLQISARESDYESFYRFRSFQRNRRILRNTLMLSHQALGFHRVARLASGGIANLAELREQTLRHFELLTLPKTVTEPWPAVNWLGQESEPVYYFGRRIDELLAEIYRDL
jgi:uncharacterized membrane protein YccC